jgi:hypothetical protein
MKSSGMMKNVKCTHCTTMFTSMKNLRRHERKHYNFIVKCRLCVFSSSRKDTVHRHMQNMHGINTWEKDSLQALDVEVNRKKLSEECVQKTKALKRNEKKTMHTVIVTHTEEVINDTSKNNETANAALKSCFKRLRK